jgi:hypothetical protein
MEIITHPWYANRINQRVSCWISVTKKTWTQRGKTVSACRKSQAGIPGAWEVRNCFQVGESRRGAGWSPAAARIPRIVLSVATLDA